LDAILIFGLGLGCLYLRNLPFKKFIKLRPTTLSVVVIFSFLAILHAALFSSPQAFNFHDDFEKYLAHPVRMLATGTLGGSDFNALGTETLGGQAFLQSFVLNHFSIVYVNAMDTVFAFLLCLLLLIAFFEKTTLAAVTVPLSMVLLTIIPDQYVNVSSNYTAVALLIFLVSLPFFSKPKEDQIRLAVVYGLVYAALLSLKSSWILAVSIHYLIILILSLNGNYFKFRFVLIVGLSAAVFVAPWIFTHIDLEFSKNGMSEQFYLQNPLTLFSSEEVFYGFGSTKLQYTFFVLLYLSCFFITWLAAGRKIDVFSMINPVLLAVVFFGSLLVIAPNLLGQQHGLRYVTPAIIGLVPVGYVLLAIRGEDRGINKRIGAMVIFSMAVGVLLFSVSEFKKYRQAWVYDNALAIPKLATSDDFIDFNRRSLMADSNHPVNRMQERIPKGSGVLVWSLFNFKLDYQRNTIFDVDPAGLTTPWLGIWKFGNSPDKMKYLRSKGIDYILFQHSGYAVRSLPYLNFTERNDKPRARKIARRTREFIGFLSDVTLSQDNSIKEGDYTLIKIELDPVE